MDRTVLGFSWLLMAALIGCDGAGYPSFADRIINEPSTADFGLAGVWRDATIDTDFEAKETTFRISKLGEVAYSVESKGLSDVEVTLRATPLREGSQSAIVEVEVSLSGSVWRRYLAVVDRQGEQLGVWWIRSENFARVMQAEGYAAVIEKDATQYLVTAEPAEILACIRARGRELVGEPITLVPVTSR